MLLYTIIVYEMKSCVLISLDLIGDLGGKELHFSNTHTQLPSIWYCWGVEEAK